MPDQTDIQIDSASELADLIASAKELVTYAEEIGVSHFEPSDPLPPVQVEPAHSVAAPISSALERNALAASESKTASVRPPPNIKAIAKARPLPESTSQKASNTLSTTETRVPTNTAGNMNETLEDIRAEIGECTRCVLCEGRTQVVHSDGRPGASLMIVGEAPGADEDAQGRPFVGRAGQLLTKIIEGIGMRREDVFIGNVNRCRPPMNRQPLPDEAATCRPYLFREIAVVKPRVIVVMGNTAMRNLLDTKIGITKLRGAFQYLDGIPVMPTFHPAYLLRDPSKKREVWDDMKKVRDYLQGQQS